MLFQCSAASHPALADRYKFNASGDDASRRRSLTGSSLNTPDQPTKGEFWGDFDPLEVLEELPNA